MIFFIGGIGTLLAVFFTFPLFLDMYNLTEDFFSSFWMVIFIFFFACLEISLGRYLMKSARFFVDLCYPDPRWIADPSQKSNNTETQVKDDRAAYFHN